MHTLKRRLSKLEKISQPRERGQVVGLVCGTQTDAEIDAFLLEHDIIRSELRDLILFRIVGVDGPAEDQPLRFHNR